MLNHHAEPIESLAPWRDNLGGREGTEGAVTISSPHLPGRAKGYDAPKVLSAGPGPREALSKWEMQSFVSSINTKSN